MVLGARLRVEQNVAGEGIEGALPGMPAVKAHFRVLPYREGAAALETVDGSKASKAAKLCLRFLILTTARSGEARRATWAKVDSEAREWRIPGERMKGGAGHRVPLSDAALVVLERARALDDGSGLIFPSPLRPGRPLSPMTLTKILRDRGLADRATVHGFRSTFRDWCAETGAEAKATTTIQGRQIELGLWWCSSGVILVVQAASAAHVFQLHLGSTRLVPCE